MKKEKASAQGAKKPIAGADKSKPVGEGLAKINLGEGIFYNPHMHLCRDVSSLWVGTLPKLDNVLDGFCASGIRGVRYLLENKNVQNITFLDASPSAISLAQKNAQTNGLDEKKCAYATSDINRYLIANNKFDLLEIDPFGTPAPFLSCALKTGYGIKERYVSVTATDTAVLCGAHLPACIKQYQAKPLDNEFCHEVAIRILMGKIARDAAQEDWALIPELSFSHRHYVKVFAKLQKGADASVRASKLAQAHLVHCPKCLWRKLLQFGEQTPGACELCGSKLDWAGPLWGGEWASKDVALKMNALLPSRPYLDAPGIGGLVSTIHSECDIAPLYYNMHELASKHKRIIPSQDGIISALEASGFRAAKTHFNLKGIRSDAPIEEVIARMSKR